MDISAESLALHYKLKGKLEVISRYPIQTQKDLSLAYTPGVAAPCLEIQKDPAKSFQLTRRQNMVAVITDGSAVLGLGDIGPVAGMPVMEGKCVLFKEFAGVDAFPLCVRHQGRGRDGQAPSPCISRHLRRHQPGGHLRPPLLRGGAAAEGSL